MISRTTICGTTQVSCPPNPYPASSRKIGGRPNDNPSTISEKCKLPCGTFGTDVGLGPTMGSHWPILCGLPCRPHDSVRRTSKAQPVPDVKSLLCCQSGTRPNAEDGVRSAVHVGTATQGQVRRGLLKVEQLHALARAVYYGQRGRISAREVYDQMKTCSCLTLILACII